ncbi:MAG: 1-phosphofructokinase family hexose kinase [Anaerolineales bacterium]|nr:1-phosphofructokinase family hexose kinase [Anaerolineales bacterium]
MIVTVTLNPGVDRTLTVPAIVFNEVMRATSVQLDWGGKGFNVARALRALGEDALAMGFVGGATGQMLARGLAQEGVATDLTPIEGESRTNIVIVPEGRADLYLGVNEAGPMVSGIEAAAFLERVRQRVRPSDIWVLSGRLPPGMPMGFYGQLVTLLQADGARVFLDASGEALRLGCAAGPYLVKPNLIEAAHIMRAEGENLQRQAGEARVTDPGITADEAADFLLTHGVALAAISLGAEGLLLASQVERVRAKPPEVVAANPVGAGDALLAGLAYALARGCDLADMARWGVAAGTASAMRAGVSFGTLAEVRAVYDEVVLI